MCKIHKNIPPLQNTWHFGRIYWNILSNTGRCLFNCSLPGKCLECFCWFNKKMRLHPIQKPEGHPYWKRWVNWFLWGHRPPFCKFSFEKEGCLNNHMRCPCSKYRFIFINEKKKKNFLFPLRNWKDYMSVHRFPMLLTSVDKARGAVSRRL